MEFIQQPTLTKMTRFDALPLYETNHTMMVDVRAIFAQATSSGVTDMKWLHYLEHMRSMEADDARRERLNTEKSPAERVFNQANSIFKIPFVNINTAQNEEADSLDASDALQVTVTGDKGEESALSVRNIELFNHDVKLITPDQSETERVIDIIQLINKVKRT